MKAGGLVKCDYGIGIVKVGDLVRVRMSHRAPKNGIVIKVVPCDITHNTVCVVQPTDGSRKIWANPLDMRVLNESR